MQASSIGWTLGVILWPTARAGRFVLLLLLTAALSFSSGLEAASPSEGCAPVPSYLAGSNARLLVSIHPTTGQATTISGMGLSGYASGVSGLAHQPATDSFLAYDAASGFLVSIDRTTGAVTPIGPIGFADVRGLAFDAASGKLYAIDAAGAQLLLIDPATGAGSVVGALGAVQASGLTLDATGLLLYSSDLVSGFGLAIDPATGTATPAAAPLGFTQVIDVALDAANGILYGVDATTAQLITIDVGSGTGTAVGALGNAELSALEYDRLHSLLYGIERGTGRLLLIDTTTGASSPVSAAVAFDEVVGMGYDSAGTALLGFDAASGFLIEIDPAQGTAEAIGAVGGNVRDLAVHPATGLVYAVDAISGDLLIIDKSTGAGVSTGITGLACVGGLEFDADTHLLYAADLCADALIQIELPSGTQMSVGPLGFDSVTALTQEPATGRFFGVDAATGGLILVNLTTGAASSVGALGFAEVNSLAVDGSGHLLAVSTALDALLRVDAVTGAATTVRRIGGNAVHGLAFDADATILYGADTETNRLIRIDARNGDSRAIGDFGGSTSVAGLAIHPTSHALFGCDRDLDQLVQINPVSGLATPVGPFGSGEISGLAFDAAGVLFGADADGTNLYGIDPATGASTLIGPFGPSGAITGLAYRAGTNQLYGVHSTDQQLVTIDRVTGTATSVGAIHLAGLEGLEWIDAAVLPECRHEFKYELVARTTPSPSDEGALPSAEEVLSCTEPFYVEFWARDEGIENTGVSCAFVDLSYDSTRIQVAGITHTTRFDQPPFASGSDDGAGLIDELGGCHLGGGSDRIVGLDPEWVCIARVQMVPLNADCRQSCDSTSTLLSSLPAVNESSAYRRGIVQAGDILYGSSAPDLRCTCLYDFNGDCLVNGTDLGVMAPSWRKCVGDPEYVAQADFDCSGCFAGGDIGFLATAWLRECSDPEVYFSPCKGCTAEPLSVISDRVTPVAPTVQFALRLSEQPDTPSPQSGDLPAGLTAGRAGRRLFAEFWMRDLASSGRGLVAGFADVRFSPQHFRVIRAGAGADFGLMASADVGSDRVIAAGGATVTNGAEPLSWVKVAVIEMEGLVDTSSPQIWLEPTRLDPAARYGAGAVPRSEIQVIQAVPVFAAPDFDRDGDVDQEDFGTMQRCLGSGGIDFSAECRAADFNGDGAVDRLDLPTFEQCASGPAVSADVGCGR